MIYLQDFDNSYSVKYQKEENKREISSLTYSIQFLFIKLHSHSTQQILSENSDISLSSRRREYISGCPLLSMRKSITSSGLRNSSICNSCLSLSPSTKLNYTWAFPDRNWLAFPRKVGLQCMTVPRDWRNIFTIAPVLYLSFGGSLYHRDASS